MSACPHTDSAEVLQLGPELTLRSAGALRDALLAHLSRSGATILGDGSVALIVDVAALIRACTDRIASPAAA